jgi:hypothetical protein
MKRADRKKVKQNAVWDRDTYRFVTQDVKFNQLGEQEMRTMTYIVTREDAQAALYAYTRAFKQVSPFLEGIRRIAEEKGEIVPVAGHRVLTPANGVVAAVRGSSEQPSK